MKLGQKISDLNVIQKDITILRHFQRMVPFIQTCRNIAYIHVLCKAAWFYALNMRKLFMNHVFAGKRLILMPFLGVYITCHELESITQKIERETSLKILGSFLCVTILYVRYLSQKSTF